MSSVSAAQARREGYVFCDVDRYWFRPAYTEGACPLCGEPAPGGAPSTMVFGNDGSWLGMAGLVALSLAMLVLVLVLYFR